MMSTKFVAICASRSSDALLYALDAHGYVWMYTADLTWAPLNTEREQPFKKTSTRRKRAS